MPTPYTLQAQGTLGAVTPGAALALAAILPLLGQIEVLLGAQFGLGALKADLTAQYKASLDLSIQVSNPAAQMQMALDAALATVATIQAAIQAGIVPPAFQVNAGLQLELIAALQIKLGAINALIELALGVRAAGLDFAGQLKAALSAGPVALYAATGQDIDAALAQISSHDYTDAGFGPGDVVTVIVLVSKAPGFHAGASFLFPLPPA